MIRKIIENCTYFRHVNDSLFCDIDSICYMNWEKTLIPPDTILFSNNNSIFYYENNFLWEVGESNGVIIEKFKIPTIFIY